MSNTQYEVKKLKQIPAVMSCLLRHKCVESTSTFTWTGGTLNAIWPEVLAFFRWTYDTTKSESQVRLFINTNTKQWKAWAFPQRANTGMTAHELTERDEGYDKTIQQRAQFPDNEWYYWGTVHHHCSGSAFQSGTDSANERGQDGLHITVGKIGSALYDIHYRTYIDGIELPDVKLTTFWDIGDPISSVPAHIRKFLSNNWAHEVAKLQMCEPPPPDQAFPEIWKENLITPPKPVVVERGTVVGGHGMYGPDYYSFNSSYCRPFLSTRSRGMLEYDLKRCVGDIIAFLRDTDCVYMELEEIIKALNKLQGMFSIDEMNLIDIVFRNDLRPIDVAKFLEMQLEILAKKEEARETMREHNQNQQGGKKGKKGKATRQEVLGHPSDERAAWESEGGNNSGMTPGFFHGLGEM